MAARVIEVAIAVADFISDPARAYGFTFITKRVNYGFHRLESSAMTFIYVYPSTYSPGPITTRETFVRTFTIVLDLVNYIDQADAQAEIDDAMLLAERLEESLENVEMAGASFQEFGDTSTGRDPFEVETAVEKNLLHVVIPVIYMGSIK